MLDFNPADGPALPPATVRPNHDIPDPYDLPLNAIDVAQARLFQHDMHHAYFRRLRAEAPVHLCTVGPFAPYWSITKYADIYAIDADAKRFSSHRDIVIGDAPHEFVPMSFIQRDDPRHKDERMAVQPAVMPRQLAQIEGLIRERAGAILDVLPVSEPFNWVEHVSKELTSQMLATLFDIPFEDRHLLPYWSDVITAADTGGTAGVDNQKRRQVMQQCLDYFTALWHERAALPARSDFVSLLAHGAGTRYMIDSPLDLLGTLMLLIVGGNDTTRNSISGGVVFLNQNPDQYARLEADHELIPSMVSEIIRYQTPLAHMRRTATVDVEVRGQQIRKGDRVVLWYVSGNRDEEAIPDADRFLLGRQRHADHLSFGYGIHRCMGNRLAEMQLRIIWEEILARFTRVELCGDVTRTESNFVNGYEAVPVRLHRR